jgi:RNA polymerase sigma-70 factor, ECF subfamily
MPMPRRERDMVTAELTGPRRAEAIDDLHALMLKGAYFELRRRRIPPGEIDDLAHEAANDALVAVLAKLETFRGDSRFTTWAYKFVLLEAAVKARKRAWHGREVVLEDAIDARPSVHELLDQSETLRAVRDAMQTELSDHQRAVLIAVALDGVPIDVLAERMGKTRGALYKTLHDARRKLRARLDA